MPTINRVLLVFFVLIIVLVSHWLGQQAYTWLPPAAAQEAEPIGDLFSFLVTLGTVIFLGVTGMLLYSLVFYRAQRGDDSDGPAIRGNNRLEVIWTVIPVLLVTWIAVYSFQIYERMNVIGPMPMVHHFLESPAIAQTPQQSNAALPEEMIEVTAKQWAWSFYYPDYQVTTSQLYLPVNHRVTLKMTSPDVLHGFYVPNFRIKQDIVPNRVIDFRFTPNQVGNYPLEDSQFSGTYFALMTTQVTVEEGDRYRERLTQLAQNPPQTVKNAAQLEHEQPPQTFIKTGWHRVKPGALPPVHSKP